MDLTSHLLGRFWMCSVPGKASPTLPVHTSAWPSDGLLIRSADRGFCSHLDQCLCQGIKVLCLATIGYMLTVGHID